MQRNEFFEKMSRAQPAQCTSVLSELSVWLTIVARDAYPEATGDMSTKERLAFLKGCNELQHLLAEYLSHYLRGATTAYPIDVLCQMVTETADQCGLGAQFDWCIARCSID